MPWCVSLQQSHCRDCRMMLRSSSFLKREISALSLCRSVSKGKCIPPPPFLPSLPVISTHSSLFSLYLTSFFHRLLVFSLSSPFCSFIFHRPIQMLCFMFKIEAIPTPNSPPLILAIASCPLYPSLQRDGCASFSTSVRTWRTLWSTLPANMHTFPEKCSFRSHMHLFPPPQPLSSAASSSQT